MRYQRHDQGEIVVFNGKNQSEIKEFAGAQFVGLTSEGIPVITPVFSEHGPTALYPGWAIYKPDGWLHVGIVSKYALSHFDFGLDKK